MEGIFYLHNMAGEALIAYHKENAALRARIEELEALILVPDPDTETEAETLSDKKDKS